MVYIQCIAVQHENRLKVTTPHYNTVVCNLNVINSYKCGQILE